MDDTEFDRALIAAAFNLMAQKGWARLSIAEAARAAVLPLDRARLRFPGRGVLLIRFGRMADQVALAEAAAEGSTRDRLFGLLMRRIDVLQAHRDGVLVLFSAIPTDPLLTLVLAQANLRSMAWMLEAAGVSATGPAGRLRAKGLLGVWLWTLRAWRGDTDPDLGPTMAALDQALQRAERLAGWLPGNRGKSPEADTPEPEPPPAAPEPPSSSPTVM